MSQIQLTGRIIGAQPFFDNGSFRKQTLIIEVLSGSYQNYYPVDFTQGDVDTLLPQVQMGGTYLFSLYVQGSQKQMTDKNGSPTAYVNLKVHAVAPAQSALPPTAQQTAPNAFQQQPQQGGFVGQPAQQPQQGFGAPQQQPAPQQGFGQQAAPAPNFGGAQTNTPPAQTGGFGAPVQGNNPFGAPQQ